jgi:hypothetical protein
MTQTYSNASNARKAARKAGLIGFTIEKGEDDRFYIFEAQAAPSPLSGATPETDDAQAALDAAQVDRISDQLAEIDQPGTLDSLMTEAASLMTEAAPVIEQQAAVETSSADQTEADAVTATEQLDALVMSRFAHTVTFRFAATNIDLAREALRGFARKLGFDLVATLPDGVTKIAALAKGRMPKQPKARRAKTAGSTGPAKPRGLAVAMMEAARRGVMPTPPDFTAETHKSYRPKLARLVEMAAAGDIAGLEAFPIKLGGSSRNAMDRYRKAAVVALHARSKREETEELRDTLPELARFTRAA